MCPGCNNHNFASKSVCNRCGSAKVGAQVAPGQGSAISASSLGNFRAGDWVCPKCNNHNFSSKIACNRCGGPKVGAQVAPGQGAYVSGYGKAPARPAPPSRPSPYGLATDGPASVLPNATGMRPGDWCCPQCNAHNFASKTACFKCFVPKMPHMHAPIGFGAPPGHVGGKGGAMGGKGGMVGEKREGDWTCHACGNNNYASRTEACNRCGLPKTVYVSKSGMRPGDWICPSCHNHNWADRTSCMKCQTPKGSSQVHTQGMKPGDWLCAGCHNHNYAGKDNCNRCQQPKGAAALTMPAA